MQLFVDGPEQTYDRGPWHYRQDICQVLLFPRCKARLEYCNVCSVNATNDGHNMFPQNVVAVQ